VSEGADGTARDPIVRPATPDDSPAIADAHIRGWQTAYRGLVPDRILDGFDVARRAAWWRDHLRDRPAATDERTWVVEADDGVAGFADAGPARSDAVAAPVGAGEVYAIYLRPEHRGQGYGRALFTAAIGDLVERGYDPLVVWVFEANHDTRRFYAASGFQPDGARNAIDFDGLAVLPEIRCLRRATTTAPSDRA